MWSDTRSCLVALAAGPQCARVLIELPDGLGSTSTTAEANRLITLLAARGRFPVLLHAALVAAARDVIANGGAVLSRSRR